MFKYKLLIPSRNLCLTFCPFHFTFRKANMLLTCKRAGNFKEGRPLKFVSRLKNILSFGTKVCL